MATKKKTKKKSTGPKRIAGGKATLAKKKLQKKPANKKAAAKKATSKKKGQSQKTISGTTASNQATRRRTRGGRARSAFSGETPGPDSGGQSGDLQGLSDVESAASESVDELLEEGNAFEAGVVSGIEDADEGDEREIHTREVPEDDVPGEYLDEE
jgi:hypothetical protein